MQNAKEERLNSINDLYHLLSEQRKMITQLFISDIESVTDMIIKLYISSFTKWNYN